METFSGGQGSFSTGVEKWWKIPVIKIPESLRPYQEIIIELIKEAFDAHGSGYK
ncbi:cephalosporin hydroxylase family protein [Clostridium gasigenes]|uniref:cephalosporin hydroxylase family protein n=1 Tax=Clostridium gasigenes TaxID=94869 RepID=UPI001C0DBF06|nr:cephalosporin hydroxylase family protein [Clostridium gasigenes]MBU3104521.1 cephalosporin hydroxylase family protein [Clostridium gasigenes]MBU3134039.1 cephalosporin hydroxylase family protein [Clostridium gasigenes]MBU3137622.1 cephalosporin hydroxylase family protein [Clostridium gasigenes]